ncbi:TRAP transporter small permease [Rhodoplanes sp. Z2-YC6860]|uniref:TRAP transporter small permease n=1 Tax=Rhodoplanes sp. Z2-YC6860 TaxID=674703 RepID=UPI00078BA5BE|nr:TRAP transporter small permease [Rhodoplanes sp. Z2-YC6860]AMN43083.1 tripartite ATP-independent periplasmic transporter DctQ [Rhodoplanes sp. Z2-YC6860]
MTRLSNAFGKLLNAFALLAALTLLGMVVMVTADIVLRNVTRSGFPWANEVSEYALYITTLLTAPWLLRRGQHVRIDLVLTAMPKRLAWMMELLGDAMGFVVCLIMMRYGIKMTIDSAALGSITIKNLVFPEWWLLWPLPVCFALLAAEFVFRFDRLVRSEPARRADATSVG